ncbi:MAG: glycosyltransferase family 2 protein [Cyanobacteria bacterium J06633_8]
MNLQVDSKACNQKVLAYITAYEDYPAVNNCVEALNNQSFSVTKILIIDNSSSQPVFISNDDKVIIQKHPENIGISGGLNIAFKFAIEKNYDFIWTFDQDSIPQKDCLEKLLKEYKIKLNTNYPIGIIAPVSIDTRTNKIIQGATFIKDHFTGCQHLSKNHAYECDAPITSGSLIPTTVAKKNPLPDIDLFIDGIDMDYGLRLKQNGYHNLIVPKAILEHKFGNPIKVKFFQQESFIQVYSALRHYYICRNHTYLSTRHAKGFYKLTGCLRRLKYMIHSIYLILLYETEQKLLKVWACFKGTIDGFQGNLGKNWY